jgi:hypothetical protein
MGKNTRDALIARGFDSEIATNLDNGGYTLKSLKNMSVDDLRTLSIPEEQIQVILNESRPPIPLGTLIKVLQESCWTCCICRTGSGVIVHHIDEYSNSRSHAEENLVVLCLTHHGEAHTKRKMQLNLTPERLKESKKLWIQTVRELNRQKLLGKTPSCSYSVWDYFNHRRLIDLSQQLGIDTSKLKNYSSLLEKKYINSDGSPAWANSDSNRYMYDFLRMSRDPCTFYSDLTAKILDNTNWVKLYSDDWNHSFINSMIKENTIVICKGGFYFKDRDPQQSFGSNQIREGLKRGNGIHLKFQFDAWETTSSSSHDSHLSGRNVVTLVCLVRSKSKIGKNLILNSSALAIGSGFGPSDNNIYYGPPYNNGYEFHENDENNIESCY